MSYFNDAHRAYADAVMKDQALKKFKKRGESIKNAERASYNSTVAADKKLRPNNPNGWYTATARSTNQVIDRAARSAINSAYDAWRREGKRASLDVDTLTGWATVSLFGVAAVQPQNTVASKGATISRRGFIAGLGVLGAGSAVFAPSEAKADNYDYINNVKSGAARYTGGKSKAIVRGVGAGIRADAGEHLNTPRPQFG